MASSPSTRSAAPSSSSRPALLRLSGARHRPHLHPRPRLHPWGVLRLLLRRQPGHTRDHSAFGIPAVVVAFNIEDSV
uniref:Uncharacterized protein n=1 Tax=Oryza brachyantha TaxID=4533 RepID=J3LR60_ORYBR